MRRRVLDSPLARALVVRYRLLVRPRRVRVHGVLVAVDQDWPKTIIGTLYDGRYEQFEADVLRETLRPGDRYLEVGAAIGVTMTIACEIVGDANVTAVEADHALAQTAARTAALNGHRPRIVNAVLTNDDRAEQRFYVREAFWGSSLEPGPGAREIVVRSRSFRGELETARATYLLVDIEGGEAELLTARLPASVRAVCLEVHPERIGNDGVGDLVRHLMAQRFAVDTRFLGAQVLFFSRRLD
jgi:FkbM family methyltransferase